MDNFEKYLSKAYNFLKYRPRSEKELRDSLLKKKAPQEIIDRIVASFKEHKFINDEEFAKWFVEQRLRFKPKSIQFIKFELKQKGVTREIIDQTIENLQSGTLEIDAKVNDLESAKKLVEQKIEKYKGMDKYEIYQKLGGFLARRGFDWDTVKKSIDEALGERV